MEKQSDRDYEESLTLADVLGANGNHLGGEYDDRIESPIKTFSPSVYEWLHRCNKDRTPMPRCGCIWILPVE